MPLCPICRKNQTVAAYRPFCSRRCADLDLQRWLESHEYESIRQMQGSMSQRNVANPAAFERANYMKVLNSFEK